MSTHTVPLAADIAEDVLPRLVRLVTQAHGGLPLRLDYDGTTLTLEHTATLSDFDALFAAAVAGAPPTSADVAAMRPQLQALRAVRQLTRNQFVNLTEADRARLVYDAIVADATLWLTVLREA